MNATKSKAVLVLMYSVHLVNWYECAQRVGKSPTQLLTGKQHPHWLELLGFDRFRRSAIVAA